MLPDAEPVAGCQHAKPAGHIEGYRPAVGVPVGIHENSRGCAPGRKDGTIGDTGSVRRRGNQSTFRRFRQQIIGKADGQNFPADKAPVEMNAPGHIGARPRSLCLVAVDGDTQAARINRRRQIEIEMVQIAIAGVAQLIAHVQAHRGRRFRRRSALDRPGGMAKARPHSGGAANLQCDDGQKREITNRGGRKRHGGDFIGAGTPGQNNPRRPSRAANGGAGGMPARRCGHPPRNSSCR